jgi:hypothetical protein
MNRFDRLSDESPEFFRPRAEFSVTGRATHREPPFQEIPIRTPEGRAVKNALVQAQAVEIFAAGYSEIERRIVLHMGDPGMLDDSSSVTAWTDQDYEDAEAENIDRDTCMCESPVDQHTYDDGHAPVSIWDYNGGRNGDH